MAVSKPSAGRSSFTRGPAGAATPRAAGVRTGGTTRPRSRPGDRTKLLGNLLTTVDQVLNLDQINAAVNSVLGATVDLLGLDVEAGSIDAELSARTGAGLILGNLLYNLANLLNPSSSSLLPLLLMLGT